GDVPAARRGQLRQDRDQRSEPTPRERSQRGKPIEDDRVDRELRQAGAGVPRADVADRAGRYRRHLAEPARARADRVGGQLQASRGGGQRHRHGDRDARLRQLAAYASAVSTDKVIISCALTGAVTTKKHCPAIPYTPVEIAEEAKRAYEAG